MLQRREQRVAMGQPIDGVGQPPDTPPDALDATYSKKDLTREDFMDETDATLSASRLQEASRTPKLSSRPCNFFTMKSVILAGAVGLYVSRPFICLWLHSTQAESSLKAAESQEEAARTAYEDMIKQVGHL